MRDHRRRGVVKALAVTAAGTCALVLATATLGTSPVGAASAVQFPGAGIASRVVAADDGKKAAAPTCTDFQIVMVRGTNESTPAGSVAPVVANEIYERTIKTVSMFAVQYPASPDFAASPPVGVAAMNAQITAQGTACPDQKFILVGYEQGASVISFGVTVGLGADAPPLDDAMRAKVSAMILIKDPSHTAGDSVNVGTAGNSSGLIARPQGIFGALGPITKDFCDAGDPICASGTSDVTTAGYYAAKYSGAAANFVIQQITGITGR